MPLPIIAAGIAARAVAKKLTTRAVAGITGRGARTVNPVYRNQTDAIQRNSVKVVKSQVQINAEGAAKARAAMGLPPKPTPTEIASRAAKEKLKLQKPRIK